MPDDYYKYLKGQGKIDRDKLFKAYPKQSSAAFEETLGGPRALGVKQDDAFIYDKLQTFAKKPGPKIVIGGPPCQAYSLVGRARNKGIKGYRAEKDNRHFLYEEYLRVLWVLKPEIFVMENVKGILSAKIKDQPVFPTILKDLTHPGKALKKRGGKEYKIYSLAHDNQSELFTNSNYILRAEDYGIPQARHRVILLGIRIDIDVEPSPLKRTKTHRTTHSVLADITPIRSGLSKSTDTPENWHKIVKQVIKQVTKPPGPLKLKIASQREIIDRSSKLKSRGERFNRTTIKFKGDKTIADWYLDKKLKGFVNHESRGHIADDLARYFFCALFSQQNDGASPRAKDFPASLAPKHANWNSGKFVDRFKVQSSNKPSSTITSHISKDGHYFIHPDPSQCRSLTVREAARLQTFPDNYYFEGTRTQQYVQVGNAVPPLLAYQIASIVYDVLKRSKS